MIEILQARSPSQAGCTHTSSAGTVSPATQRAGAGGKKAPQHSWGAGTGEALPVTPGTGTGRALRGASGCGVAQAASSAGATALLPPRGLLPSRAGLGTGPGPCSCPHSLCSVPTVTCPQHGAWAGPSRCPHPLCTVPAVTCPQCGGAAPPGGVAAQDTGHREKGQWGQPLVTDPAAGALPWPWGRERSTQESSSAPLFRPPAATGTFVTEEHLSKLEKTATHTKKKRPSWGNIPELASPPPSSRCASAGKGYRIAGSCWGQGDSHVAYRCWGAWPEQSSAHGRLLSSRLP